MTRLVAWYHTILATALVYACVGCASQNGSISTNGAEDGGLAAGSGEETDWSAPMDGSEDSTPDAGGEETFTGTDGTGSPDEAEPDAGGEGTSDGAYTDPAPGGDPPQSTPSSGFPSGGYPSTGTLTGAPAPLFGLNLQVTNTRQQTLIPRRPAVIVTPRPRPPTPGGLATRAATLASKPAAKNVARKGLKTILAKSNDSSRRPPAAAASRPAERGRPRDGAPPTPRGRDRTRERSGS